MNFSEITKELGADADTLLKCEAKIPKSRLHLPGHDFVDRVWVGSDRTPNVLRNLQTLFNTGRLGGSGYLSILPVDQGIEHSAGASFAPNPDYFDPENIVKLAIEGGCNGVASTLGVLGAVAAEVRPQDSVHPQDQPQRISVVPQHATIKSSSRSVKQAFDMGGVGVGATVYFGSEESHRQIQEVTARFPASPRNGHVHHPLVLPAQQRVQDQGQGLSIPPPT